MRIINKNQFILFSGIFGFFLASIVFGTVNAVDENNAELIESAMNFLKMNEIDKAIPLLEDVIEKDPNNFNVLKNLAIAYADSEMCDKSIKLYDKLLELKPNSPEILYGKAVCFNEIGQPENALFNLDKMDKKYSNDNSILITIANANVLLGEFENAQKNYQKVLDKDPNSKSANLNMLLLSSHINDHKLAEEILVKLLGENPERLSSTCGSTGCMGKIPFLFPVKETQDYQITVQIQVRDKSNELIAIIESDQINYTPHPIMNKVLSDYDVVNTFETEYGIFEEKHIVQKIEPKINSYFMDRVEFYHNDYSILFAYNLAIPLEPGDYIITEWIIQKKSNVFN